MRAASRGIKAAAAVVALVLAGCQIDAARVAELESPGVVSDSVVTPDAGGSAATEESGETSSADTVATSLADTEAAASGGGSSNDPFGGLGLLGPVVPGFSPDLFSSSCNPLEDPYSACL